MVRVKGLGLVLVWFLNLNQSFERFEKEFRQEFLRR